MDKDDCLSPTPFTPPLTEEDTLSWLRLIRSPRVGPATFLRLMGEHGSAAAALDALPGIARAAGVMDYTPCPADRARDELDRGRRIGAEPLFLGSPDYPAPLAAISDPPPVLWAQGRPARRAALLDRPAVALVGARNASSLGLRMARKLAEGLAAHGLVVVSGLARGIDTVAHGAALDGGTIAVMAGGVDVVYPPENDALAAAIADRGLRLSEQPCGLQPQARHFPRRNRLIAGLAQAVVVVEAAEGSGSLITARDALDQGREVLAVPGHPMDARAGGCNLLIREGARLIRGVEDVIEALGASVAPARSPDRPARARVTPAGTGGQSPAPRGPAPERDRTADRDKADTPAAPVRTGPARAVPDPAGPAPHARTGGQPVIIDSWSPGTPHPGPAQPRPVQAGVARPGPADPGTTGSAAGAAAGPVPLHPGTTGPGIAGPGASKTIVSGHRLPDVGTTGSAAAGPVLLRPGATGPGTADQTTRATPTAMPAPADPARLHGLILGALGPSPVAEDQLLRDLALPANQAAPALLFLELSGRIRRAPGGLLALA